VDFIHATAVYYSSHLPFVAKSAYDN
jgi:hypothetical protein